jgi:5-methylcytosine-specific restriction protein A
MGRLKALPVSRLRRAEARMRSMPKTANPFYLSPEWRQLVARRKLDSDWFAAKARAKAGERLILDHDHEIKDGGALLDPANTVWRTMSEHQAKTAKRRAERARGLT